MSEIVFRYYRRLIMARHGLSVESIKTAACGFLAQALPDTAPDFFSGESWEKIVLGLYANGAQFCAGCLSIKPISEFTAALDCRSRCQTCRVKKTVARKERASTLSREKRAGRRYLKNLIGGLCISEPVKRRLLTEMLEPNRRRRWLLKRAPADQQRPTPSLTN